MKTATITEKGQIAIPKDLRKIEGFKAGSKLVILAFKDHVELRPMKQVATMLASEKSLAKDWLSKEENKRWKHL